VIPPLKTRPIRILLVSQALATLAFAVAMLLLVPFAVLAAEPLQTRLAEIEGRLVAFPRVTVSELAQIAADAAPADASLDRQVKTMYGKALVLSNRTTDALDLAERMQAAGANDPAMRAGALLIRSEFENWAGNSAKAHEFAAHAREVAAQSDDEYVRYATAYAAGVTARMMGRVDAALASLEEARALAEGNDLSFLRVSRAEVELPPGASSVRVGENGDGRLPTVPMVMVLVLVAAALPLLGTAAVLVWRPQVIQRHLPQARSRPGVESPVKPNGS